MRKRYFNYMSETTTLTIHRIIKSVFISTHILIIVRYCFKIWLLRNFEKCYYCVYSYIVKWYIISKSGNMSFFEQKYI